MGQIPIPEPTNCVLRSKKNLTALLAILRLELGKDHAPDEEHVRREMKQQTPLPWAGFSAPGCCSTESLSDPRKAQTLAGPIADRGCALPVAASCLSAFACSTKPLQSLRSRGHCLLFFFLSRASIFNLYVCAYAPPRLMCFQVSPLTCERHEGGVYGAQQWALRTARGTHSAHLC